MDCPNCSQPGAVRRWFKVRCPNPACPAYDIMLRGAGSGAFAVHVHPPASPPPEPERETPAIRSRVAGQVGGAGIAWILWLLAYALFRIGSRADSNKVVLWGLAGAVALVAFTLGRRAAAAAPAAVEDDDAHEEDDEDPEDPEPDQAGEGNVSGSGAPFDATGDRRVEIRYLDQLDRERLFVADRTSLRLRGLHLVARVEPVGGRLAFRLDRILNRADVEGAIPA